VLPPPFYVTALVTRFCYQLEVKPADIKMFGRTIFHDLIFIVDKPAAERGCHLTGKQT